MSRSIADAPAYVHDSAPKDRSNPARFGLPMEIALWIQVSLLIVGGVIMIYSASSSLSLKSVSDHAEHFRSTGQYLYKQLFCIGLGLIALLVVRRVPYRLYMNWAPWMLLAAVAALTAVLVPGLGVEVNGARRWFHLKFFLLQPAEYAKVIWVVFLSASLYKKQDRIKRMGSGFVPHMVWCGILAVLLLLEPDFGTTFMIGCLTVIMLAVGGVPMRHLFLLVPVGVLGFYKAVYHVPYRWERITSFMNPWTDPLDSGYQLIQAWIAVGSGGWLGKGLGASQQKLFYLPEAFTDFIFAVIGEEVGLLGILAVVLLFFWLFVTGFKIARSAPDHLGCLLAMGLTMQLTLQAILNMGVVLGLFPTKGLPLPFLSYGGSAFTANCVAVGILMNIARSSQQRVE